MRYKILCILFAAILAGCAAPTPATVNVEVTRIVLQTVVVTQIVERVITATPLPTNTPTPIPTPTPVYTSWTAEDVVEAFQAAGLEVGKFRDLTDEDYGFAPTVATGGIRFFIPSLCYDCGGRIFIFDDPIMLEAVKGYYDKLGADGVLYFSWTLKHDNVLVQINGDLPEAKMKLYKEALETLQ